MTEKVTLEKLIVNQFIYIQSLTYTKEKYGICDEMTPLIGKYSKIIRFGGDGIRVASPSDSSRNFTISLNDISFKEPTHINTETILVESDINKLFDVELLLI